MHFNVVDRKGKEDKRDKEDRGDKEEKVLSTLALAAGGRSVASKRLRRSNATAYNQ